MANFIPKKPEKSCSDQRCRVDMIQQMYETVKGTVLLLEEIQSDPDVFSLEPSENRKKNAFKTLIATMLSVRTKDETTIQVIEQLWQHYATPQAIADAPIEHLEELIRSSGTYRQKAKRIKETSRLILEQHNGVVPDNLEELIKLPGVGRKVANCVLVVSYCIPAIPVDTHVHRISNRIGWVDTTTPEETEKALEKLFPIETWTKINYTMVSFGKNICKPTNPQCQTCPIAENCLKLITETAKKHKKASKASKITQNKKKVKN